MLKPWPKKSSKQVGDFRIFTIRSDVKTSPRTGKEHEFYVLDCVNWVNVVPVTPDGQVVMVEQFRHGSEAIELEVPGGLMDVGDASPLDTAVRELREETGFEGTSASLIGSIRPNPAIMSNVCHTVLVENAALKHPTAWDGGEDLVTRLVPICELEGLVATGKIQHSLVIVALFHFQIARRGR